MLLTILGSGSGGNAAVIQKGEHSILVDIGFSYRELSRRLRLCGISPESISSVFITHEHFDHIRGMKEFSRKHSVSIYVSEGTYENLFDEVKEVVKGKVGSFKTGENIELNGMSVKTFPVLHDAADPAGFTFSSGCKKIGYVTDIGSITDTVVSCLEMSSLIVLEANHDIDMLWNGSYPEYLKQRISGPHGHLSNDNALELLQCVMCKELRGIYLAHLSKENNRPELAFQTVYKPLAGKYNYVPKILIAKQDTAAEPYRL
ncbi:hypothetical protein AMJ80_04645 [bacterium SM23_31]|nr:MAG: hypothetical protein AMJ80_04645 [bacterium SM23_31]